MKTISLKDAVALTLEQVRSATEAELAVSDHLVEMVL